MKRILALLALALAALTLLAACELKPAAPFQLGPYREESGDSGGRRWVRGSGDVSAETDVNAHMRGQEWTLRVDLPRITTGVAKIVVDESLPFAGKLETDSNIQAGLHKSYNLSKREIILRGEKDKWYAPTVLTFTVGLPVNRLIINGGWKLEYNCPGVTDCDIEINGAVDGDLKFGALDTLRLDINGASNCKLTGTAKRVEIEMDGAADISAFDLIAQEASVTLNGAGECEIMAEQTLRAEINGVGSVIYDGNPRVDKAVHGIGTVRKR